MFLHQAVNIFIIFFNSKIEIKAMSPKKMQLDPKKTLQLDLKFFRSNTPYTRPIHTNP